MKNCFLVLSDIHMKDNQWIDEDIVSSMCQVLNTVGTVDEIGLIIAGDISFSGQVNEYKKAGIFISMLSKKIREKFNIQHFLPVYMVPGNHDINFGGRCSGREEVLKLIKSNNIDEFIDDELVAFENFYELANFNNCFVNDRITEVRFFRSNYENTQINLINSELFSTLEDENGDDDKGVHYFPEAKITQIGKRKFAKYCITVMHRTPDWFEYDSMLKLKNKIYKNSNILICGHEHNSNASKLSRKENDIFLINTGKFDFNEKEFNFTLIEIDSNEEKCSIKDYAWQEDDNLFVENNVISGDILEINVETLKPTAEFTSEFYMTDNNSVKDIFVFPDLDRIDEKDINSIKSVDEFFDLLKEKNIIYIEGPANSGKTTLCKEIYRKSFNFNKTPLYLNMEETSNKKYNRIIKDAIAEQYGYEKIEQEKFKQLSKDEILVLVDNLDVLIDNNIFCSNLETEFKNIVYLYKPKNRENIVEETKQNLSKPNNRLRILPFYLRKRKELINKLLTNSGIKIENANEKVDEINKFIMDQIKIFSLDPSFITKYVDLYLKQNNTIDLQNNVFNQVFESSIVVALQGVIPHDSIGEYMAALENLAHEVHFSKLYPFNVNDINRIILKYNEDFMMNIDCSKFRKNVLKANILEDLGNDNYRFANNSYLAYFTASAINKRFNNDLERHDIDWICNNLCFNINGEIFLFLSYITSNKRILNYIFEKAGEIINNWNELDLDNTDITFLLPKNLREETISKPSKTDQELHEENLENQEKSIIKNLEVKTKSIYDDYDETKIDSKQYISNQAMRYLELISKVLPNFNHDLRKNEKIEIVKALYSYPNKVCNEILQNIDNNLNATIEDLMKYCELKKLNLTKEEIILELEKSAEYFILNLFDMVARLSTNKKTISVLDSQELKTINYKLLNVMMHENLGNFTDFAEKADKLHDNTKNKLVKSMIKAVIRKHFLCNKNLVQVHYVQKIADKYFGNNRKYLK